MKLDDLIQGFRSAGSEVVPWFEEQMPKTYLEDTPEADRVWHLRSIIAAKSSGLSLNMTFASSDGRKVTAMREGNKPGMLAEIVNGLPKGSLRAARIHCSGDGSLIVDTFEFGDQPAFDASQPTQAAKVREILNWAKTNAPDLEAAALEAHIQNCPADYVLTVSPLRLSRQRRVFLELSGSDGAKVEIEPEADGKLSRVTLAVANSRTRTMLQRSATVLAKHGISIVRAYLDVIQDPPHGVILFVGYVVQKDGKAIDPASAAWKTVAHELARAKWVDHRVLALESRVGPLDLEGAELFSGFAALVHQKLCGRDAVAYGIERIWELLEEHLPLTQRVIELFKRRFDPVRDLSDAAFESELAALRKEAQQRSDTPNAEVILATLCDALAVIRRTNFFVPGRFALAFRLEPQFMVEPPKRENVPFGLFFVHGRGFNGFHVRFKEIARGGLRVVLPQSLAQYERGNERLYDEAYGLASAQQQKNKDIPEGGSKAALVAEIPEDIYKKGRVRPDDPEVGTIIRRCVKAFTDAILDLITPEPRTREKVRDRLGFQEFIYLGPDENIVPEHIEWIVARARRRGYPLANAFMSSKPRAGLNHKTYGVTSEGVNVYLDTALRARGIDPKKQPFTIKVTGGPDGDVAGNMLRILERDYGANAKVVGVGDGSGCGEDPEGLDKQELVRLFREGLPIASFDKKKLSPRGRVVTADTAEGQALRNSLHNRLVTDAFVPGGGRPETINARNWRDFLTSDGKPSSGIIVEGANLFLTPEARAELSKLGALIYKDSSANKCGVICSSYEIQASMLLEDDQFMAIKEQYAAEVLEKLRVFARLEARALLAEAHRHSTVSLPELSVKLSKAMNEAADIVYQALATWTKDDPLYREVVLNHVVPVLVKTVGEERIFEGLPKPYLDWMVAKGLSSRLVYREGIDFFATIDRSSVGDVVHRYVEKERDMRRLAESVRKSGIPDAARAADLLERAGARAATFES